MSEPAADHENSLTIERVEMGTGWVCFQGGDPSPPPDQLPYYLNDAVSNWLLRHPQFRVRTVLPVTVAGNLVAVNVWFD
jgi:hypothetical protein